MVTFMPSKERNLHALLLYPLLHEALVIAALEVLCSLGSAITLGVAIT